MSGRMRRAVLGAVVVALLGSDVVALKVVAARVTPVTVDEAVHRYRARLVGESNPTTEAAAEPVTGSGGHAQVPVAVAGLTVAAHRAPAARPADPTVAPGRPLTPTPGVYTYATKGYEEVSVLGGSRHTYPDQTTMTVTATACGDDVRWDGLDQRWDQWTTCTAGHAIALRAFVTYHNFYGQVLKQSYTCDPGTQFRPETTAAGATFTGRCDSGSAVAAITGRVAGTELVAVGATAVPALRVHLDERLTGDTQGTRTSDSWYALDTGLVLRRTSVTDADTQAVIGSTHYHEELAITATALVPRQ